MTITFDFRYWYSIHILKKHLIPTIIFSKLPNISELIVYCLFLIQFYLQLKTFCCRRKFCRSHFPFSHWSRSTKEMRNKSMKVIFKLSKWFHLLKKIKSEPNNFLAEFSLLYELGKIFSEKGKIGKLFIIHK